MAMEQNQFLLPQQSPAPQRNRCGGCWGGMSCFRKQKGGKRVVPASRVPEANALLNQANGPQAVGLPNQTMGIALSLLAPPSSPASFSNSALHSTAQSPNCLVSANSPGGPPSNMFVTGPYAHETQLISPPVFSTFTTEPSSAPLTPPPELAHLTTPSSPDVPYAHFLSSSAKIKLSDKTNYVASNDLQAMYSLYPESPASTLRSPVSGMSGDCVSPSLNDREFPPQWDPSIPLQEPVYAKSDSGRFLQLGAAGVASNSGQRSNFFCPETFAQFYDQSSFSNSGGRLSISRESGAYSNGGNGHQNRQNKTCKQDAEELDAYRASFGFSADEIITTTNYVEISNVLQDSFSMAPVPCSKPVGEERVSTPAKEEAKTEKRVEDFSSPQLYKAAPNHANGVESEVPVSYNVFEDQVPHKKFGDAGGSLHNNHILCDDDDVFSKKGFSRIGWKYQFGSSNSDAEIEYGRGQSLRERRGLIEN